MSLNKILYETTNSLIEKSKEFDLPLEKVLTKKYINVLQAIANNSEKYGNEEKTSERLNYINDLVISNALKGKAREFLENTKYFEAFNYLKNKNLSFEELGFNPEINKKYLEKLKKETLNSPRKLNPGETIDLFVENYNLFMDSVGEDSRKIKLSELDISKFFDFGLRAGLELEKGDCGKYIISFDADENKFKFNASIISDIMPKDQTPEGLREFFQKERFGDFAGYHRNIPSFGQRLGGGAYLMLDNSKIFVDFKSVDFGWANKELVENCLKNANLEMQILDDRFFEKTSLNEYIINKLDLQDKEEYSSNLSSENDDDLPF